MTIFQDITTDTTAEISETIFTEETTFPPITKANTETTMPFGFTTTQSIIKAEITEIATNNVYDYENENEYSEPTTEKYEWSTKSLFVSEPGNILSSFSETKKDINAFTEKISENDADTTTYTNKLEEMDSIEQANDSNSKTEKTTSTLKYLSTDVEEVTNEEIPETFTTASNMPKEQLETVKQGFDINNDSAEIEEVINTEVIPVTFISPSNSGGIIQVKQLRTEKYDDSYIDRGGTTDKSEYISTDKKEITGAERPTTVRTPVTILEEEIQDKHEGTEKYDSNFGRKDTTDKLEYISTDKKRVTEEVISSTVTTSSSVFDEEIQSKHEGTDKYDDSNFDKEDKTPSNLLRKDIKDKQQHTDESDDSNENENTTNALKNPPAEKENLITEEYETTTYKITAETNTEPENESTTSGRFLNINPIFILFSFSRANYYNTLQLVGQEKEKISKSFI